MTESLAVSAINERFGPLASWISTDSFWRGSCIAAGVGVGVSHHRDLEAWQLADEVRRAFIELTSRQHVKRDFDFCDQSRRAANSACKNTAEGFARFQHQDFARFVNIARGSLAELLDSTDEAIEKGYIDTEEYRSLNDLIERAKASATGLHQYLVSTPTPRRPKRPRESKGR
jgi:four helix bundle protein